MRSRLIDIASGAGELARLRCRDGTSLLLRAAERLPGCRPLAVALLQATEDVRDSGGPHRTVLSCAGLALDAPLCELLLSTGATATVELLCSPAYHYRCRMTAIEEVLME